ncbi:MAG: M1 family metallopeptidase [Chitinophagaceae bacterium]|nr:M1 family metallopeptidase [Chitinophagaceae bacterium]
MKNIFLSLLLTICFFSLTAQEKYWQQQVNYKIDVTLNDKENTLSGFAVIEYFNFSPDTLHFIWFHLWPNAYRNDKTAFSEQLLENGNTRFYFSSQEEKGYMNRLEFKVNGLTAATQDHPEHIDVMKVLLPSPLPPGKSVKITTPFHVKLPFNISRGGFDGQSYQATQWYPKPAVYDKKGWHPMPYLDQGEFYSEFGNFDVRITVPKNYVVAASGVLQNQDEKEWLNSRAGYSWNPEKEKVKTNNRQTAKTHPEYPESDPQTKTLHFVLEQAHDFAWFADKRFIVNTDTCRLASGRVIEVFAYYTPQQKKFWSSAVFFAKRAIRHYSTLVGEYPYPVVHVVQGPESFGGGMEYPTITVISPVRDLKSLDLVIAHEIGHNWFYGILASNERKYPWLDEGLNTFYDRLYEKKFYGEKPLPESFLFEHLAAEKLDQPINTHSEKFNARNYSLVAYYKTSEWMNYLRDLLTPQVFDTAMQEYFRRWKFRHPDPESFQKTLEEVSGKDLTEAFSLLSKKGLLPHMQKSGFKWIFFPPLHSVKSWLQRPTKNILFLSPLTGFNMYDKAMAGVLLTNLKLPLPRLKFLFIPLFGPGTKKINGIGFLHHSFFPERFFRKIEIGVSASGFSNDKAKNDIGELFYTGFRKIVPGIRFTLNSSSPRSTINRFFSFKQFFFREEAFRFSRDTIYQGTDTIITTNIDLTAQHRSLAQWKFVLENTRELYPYRGEWLVEKGKEFLRTSFTGNYFFNYPREGGLSVRFFAGKFFYLKPKSSATRFATDRFHLNMTGANGYEDYTYSDYFIGRNAFEGLPSQQIMIRDGAFKVRTDLLASEVGKNDNWLMAVNFSSTIPHTLNPFQALPFTLPVKLYADIGTQAEAWKTDSEQDRFLYNAGIQIPLFKETLNIYIPLAYSRVYKDYFLSTMDKKNRFWKKISFAVDISTAHIRKIIQNFPF